MDGWIIAVVLVIISLTSTANTAGVVLHKEVQSAECVEDWHMHSHELWTQQNETDKEIVDEAAELRQVVTSQVPYHYC